MKGRGRRKRKEKKGMGRWEGREVVVDCIACGVLVAVISSGGGGGGSGNIMLPKTRGYM